MPVAPMPVAPMPVEEASHRWPHLDHSTFSSRLLFVSCRFVCARGRFSSALLLSSPIAMRAAPVSSELGSTTGRVMRPAVPTSPGG
eukprot:6543097-Prymnesium_polylepis.1